MARARTLAGALVIAFAACGGGDPPPDVFVPIDIDNGECGAEVRFTGELVDWDWTETHACGIFGAGFRVPGAIAPNNTAPNGRFDLCVPDQATTVLEVTPPAAASDCTDPDGGLYTMPGLAVANKLVIQSGGFWSGRAFPDGRETIDPAKAQVFVHVDGTPRAVSIAATHGEVQAQVAETWAPGDTGHEVFFRNVDVTGGSTTLSVAGGATGTGTIPLAANTITMISVIAK